MDVAPFSTVSPLGLVHGYIPEFIPEYPGGAGRLGYPRQVYIYTYIDIDI